MAECMLGHGDRAYEYYKATLPSAYNTRAEVRQSEPYVHARTSLFTFLSQGRQHAYLVVDRGSRLELFQRHAIYFGYSTRK